MKSLLEYITEDIPKRDKDIHKEDIHKIDEDIPKINKDIPKIDKEYPDFIKEGYKVSEVEEFCKEYGSKESKNRFWTHIDKKDPRKLVIHTRQFSNGISKDLIKEMASVIREHLRKLGLI